MSGPAVSGQGGGDFFGNLFGGSQKQVYPPAPPGYKYVDLNIPQAPPGYTVAKMSQIANNQSTPATLGGNAGLVGVGRSAIYGGTSPHSDAGIIARANQRAIDNMRRNELMGLVPSGSTDALRTGRPLPVAGAPALPGATAVAGVPTAMPGSAAAPPAGIDYTKGGTISTSPPPTALPPALVAAVAAGKRPKNPYPYGTPEWAQWDVASKAILAQQRADAQKKFGINTGGGSMQDQIDAYVKAHGGTLSVTPPAAPPTPPAATAPMPPSAPPAVTTPPPAPPTPPNSPPSAPPPNASAPVENVPAVTAPPDPAAAQPVSKIDATIQTLKNMWNNITGSASVPQKYDPLAGAAPPEVEDKTY